MRISIYVYMCVYVCKYAQEVPVPLKFGLMTMLLEVVGEKGSNEEEAR
jgi:hypothetical protein